MTRARKLSAAYLLTAVGIGVVGHVAELPTWQHVIVSVLAITPVAAVDIYLSTRDK